MKSKIFTITSQWEAEFCWNYSQPEMQEPSPETEFL